MNVAGVWEASELGSDKRADKGQPFSLRIIEVDGKQLTREHQVVINGNCVKWLTKVPPPPHPLCGEKVQGRVCECGSYDALPKEAQEVMEGPTFQGVHQTDFVSSLYFFDYKSLGGGKEPEPARLPIIRPEPPTDELLPGVLTPETPGAPSESGDKEIGRLVSASCILPL